MNRTFRIAVVLGVSFALKSTPRGMETPPEEPSSGTTGQASNLEGLEYRSLGFSRGGRSTAVAGTVTEPRTFYFGSTGGGVWKTTDGGITWMCPMASWRRVQLWWPRPLWFPRKPLSRGISAAAAGLLLKPESSSAALASRPNRCSCPLTSSS